MGTPKTKKRAERPVAIIGGAIGFGSRGAAMEGRIGPFRPGRKLGVRRPRVRGLGAVAARRRGGHGNLAVRRPSGDKVASGIAPHIEDLP
ncbi:hypothetical protein RSP03_19490 [Cereibacter sphaeroides]|nr:hypothetical protein RSP03_19490 [Cereibacter sphaeroides]